MNDQTKLQRRYRRLLAFYPKKFRREHGQEMESVLMTGAAVGQQRPGLGESSDLVGHGLWMRLRYGTRWERTHYPRAWFGLRLAVGVWLLIITAILCQQGDWWALALLAPAALHFYLAYCLSRVLESGG